MTEQAFEARLARVLRRDAERAVRPFDPVEIASAAQRAPTGRLDWLPAHAGARVIRSALVLAILVAAILATLWVIAVGGRHGPRVVDATPAPTGRTTAEVAAALAGSWIADKPADLSFGDPSGPARMILVVDANGAATYVKVSSGPGEHLPSGSEFVSPEELQVTARAGAFAGRGREMQPCAVGAVGRYRLAPSDDRLRLALTLIDDACLERAAVLARTWTRSLGEPNAGGAGVVDAFDPLFTVSLPPGSYDVDRSIDALTIVQLVPEFQFISIRDPQGFLDPCNQSAGRRAIAAGADAFVTYFRQLHGFTVDSVTDLQVDGHRAVRLVVRANADASCPDGRLVEWQPKADTSDRSWFLRPGDTDSLVLVEVSSSTTLLFEVLPAPHRLESDVIGSIRFLQGLPATP